MSLTHPAQYGDDPGRRQGPTIAHRDVDDGGGWRLPLRLPLSSYSARHGFVLDHDVRG
jgi:hypothetical protein